MPRSGARGGRRGAACTALLVAAIATATAADEAPLERRGEYLYRAAGCENCHTEREQGGAPLAGGRALTTPFGTFYAPNITPDRSHGIGRWSEADFVRALREGVSPTGTHYYPAFPYTAYTRLSDADLRALWRYVRAQPAVPQPNRGHALAWYARFRAPLALWKWRYFKPGAYQAAPDRSQRWNRGAYLVQALAHCGECHTPRDRFGGPLPGRELAGSTRGPDGGVVPNITPDRKTGIGSWSKRDLATYLETGMTPDGDFAGDLMAEVIDHGLSHLSADDRFAIAEYVFSLAPIEHRVRKQRTREEFSY